MNIQDLTHYFLQYGAFFIYLIVLLEYLNLPGFPAGVIMPLAGIWAAQGEISFPLVMVLTVAAGLTGSWALYLLGRYSKAPACDRRENELSQGERMHRCICEQAAPDGAHPHLDPGWYGENGFCQIYSEFRVRDILMEPDICRGGIFLRRRGDQILYIREGSRI